MTTSAFKTAEGFYLTTNKQVADLPTANIDIKLLDGLLLSELDYSSFDLTNTIAKIASSTNEKLCQLYKSFINMYSKLDDEFFTFSDYYGNEAVLYSDQGRIFIPDCILINEINAIEETVNCFKDFPITFKIDNKTINAFLTNEKIIKSTSKLTDCKNNYQNLVLHESNRILIKSNNKVTIENNDKFKILNFNLLNINLTEINFNHDNRIITSLKLAEKIANLTTIKENNGDFNILQSLNTDFQSKLDTYSAELALTKQRHLITVLTSITSTIFILSIILVLIRVCLRILC